MRTPNMILEARRDGRGENWSVELLIFILLFLAASLIEFIPLFISLGGWIMSNPTFLTSAFDSLSGADADLSTQMDVVWDVTNNLPDWYFLLSLYCTSIVIGACLFFCRVFQKRSAATLGFRRSHALREYLVGAVAAFAAMTAVVAAGLIAGAFTISMGPGVSLGMLLLYFAGYLIQGMSEEVLCRGYLMTSIARKNPIWLSVLLSALVFSALHFANFGFSWMAFLNIAFFGVFMSVYALKRGNIWGVSAFHSLWNFIQGQIYGIDVSGTGSSTSLLNVHFTGPDLLTGGDFGVEGGLFVTLILAVGMCILLFLVPEKKDEFSAA